MLTSTKLVIPPAPGDTRIRSVVNAIVEDLIRAKHVDEHTAALKAYGALAVPGLLLHLHTTDPARRAIAFYGLQYCWSQSAREPVAALLKENDPSARHMAALVLAKHEGLASLAKLCEPLLHDPRPALAGFGFERVEGEGPDLGRMLRFMRKPGMWDYTWKFLPRYYDSALTPATLNMLGRGGVEPGIAAAAALIHQQKRSATIRQGLVQFLTHSAPELREITAEYLQWHGMATETAALRGALARERDPFTEAAMEAALAAIARREQTVPGAHLLGTKYSSRSLVLPRTEGRSLLERYRTALGLLFKPKAAVGDWRAAFELYRKAETFEPHWAYKGDEPPQDFVAARQARLELQAKLFAIPAPAFGLSAARDAELAEGHRGEFGAEPAASFMPPLRAYFDPARESFGKVTEEDAVGFTGMVHAADDVGWYRDHRTVVASANGLVRQVRCAPSWGCLVIIEHLLPDGKFFCSLYAHLSAFICVLPGQVVKKGQKIGSIGRSLTWENGGYLAHLHFGIHKGPYWQAFEVGAPLDVRYEGKHYVGRVVSSDVNSTLVDIHHAKGAQQLRRSSSWVSGYVSKECWEHKRHGWVDPQHFLKEHAKG
ncbi:MAG: peptidoglycan DD-metalloendopeptidase family protein [Planctomycetota bacterium]